MRQEIEMANETDTLKAYRDRLIDVVKQSTAYGTDMKAAISLIEYVNAKIIKADMDKRIEDLKIISEPEMTNNEIGRLMGEIHNINNEFNAIREAAIALVDAAANAPKSDCEHCGDGRASVVWKSDLDQLRKVVEND